LARLPSFVTHFANSCETNSLRSVRSPKRFNTGQGCENRLGMTFVHVSGYCAKSGRSIRKGHLAPHPSHASGGTMSYRTLAGPFAPAPVTLTADPRPLEEAEQLFRMKTRVLRSVDVTVALRMLTVR